MSSNYRAADIEVLSGLEPVRRRPGMYTDTTRPNHLAHEVVDNSVDEAVAGHAKKVDVVLYADGSLEVADDGRGMDAVTCRNALQPGYSTRADGHGVGLASVVDTVRSHRGGLAVVSAPGRGARFTALFPAVNESTCRAASP